MVGEEGCPPDNQYNVNYQTQTVPTPFGYPLVATVVPASRTSTCHWIDTLNFTITYEGNNLYSIGQGSSEFICCGGDLEYGLTSLEGYTVESYLHPTESPPPTPTPGVDIFDYNLNKIVTNTTQSALAGQDQLLQAVPSREDISLNSCNWTLSGNTVGSYAANGASPSPAPTSAAQVPFYWIGSGSNSASANDGVSVKCIGSPSSATLIASATYDVYQPTYSASQVTYGSAVTAYLSGYLDFSSGIFIAYATGPSPSPTPGIIWSYKVSAPSGAVGQIAMGQLIDIDNVGVPSPSPTPTTLGTTDGSYWLDGAFPYETPAPYTGTWSRYDEPAQQITNGFSSVQLSYMAKDFFMFLPDNDNVGSSIWVTLAQASWSFITTGTRVSSVSPGHYTWNTGSTTVGGTSLSASYTLPTWSNVFNPSPKGLARHKSHTRSKIRLIKPHA